MIISCLISKIKEWKEKRLRNKIILSLYLLPVENGVFLFSTGSFFAPNPHNLSFRQIVTHIFIHSYFPVFSPVFRVIHIVHNFIHIFTIHTMWIPCV